MKGEATDHRRMLGVACSAQEVATGIGATSAEIDLLYQDDLIVARGLKDYRYSEAWEPHKRKKGADNGPRDHS